MASFLNKIRMKSAKNKIDYKDFTHQHLTTQNFCQIMPITNTELIPDSKVSCNPSTFCRFEPMPQPTFMKVNIINRAFFVPYELVWKPFHAFITRTAYTNSTDVIYPLQVPTVTMQVLNEFFATHLSSAPTAPDYEMLTDAEVLANKPNDYGQAYDVGHQQLYGVADIVWVTPSFSFNPNNHNTVAARLSSKGRMVIKVLESLGYKIDTFAVSYEVSNEHKKFALSALPLLCYAKIFLDWYYPTQYSSGTDVFNKVDKILHRESVYELSVTDLYDIFELVTSFFSEDNYFVNSFDHPFTPDTPFASALTPDVLAQPSAKTYTSPLGTSFTETSTNIVSSGGIGSPKVNQASPNDYGGSDPLAAGTNITSDNSQISSWAIAAVSRLGAWLHRNQLSGAKVIDRFLARYGVQLPAEKLMRSYYLGEQKFSAMFSDVMSTAETSDGSLGDYAGKGVAFDDSKTFEFDTNEFGQFIVTNVVYPHVSYTQGFDRQLRHLSVFDYYQPEFDGLGMQPVFKGELLCARNSQDIGTESGYLEYFSSLTDGVVDAQHNFGDYIRKVFGFQPRYAEYKCPRDRQTGNFTNPTTNRALPAWSPNRYFQLFKFGPGSHYDQDHGDIVLSKDYIPDLVHSVDFMKDNGIQYLRLFYSSLNSMDCINFIHTFNMHVSAPILPLYDSFEFDNDKNKQDVTIGAQGSKLT